MCVCVTGHPYSMIKTGNIKPRPTAGKSPEWLCCSNLYKYLQPDYFGSAAGNLYKYLQPDYFGSAAGIFFILPVLRLHKHRRPDVWTSWLSSHDRTPITQTTATFRALDLTTHIPALTQAGSYAQLGTETHSQTSNRLKK